MRTVFSTQFVTPTRPALRWAHEQRSEFSCRGQCHPHFRMPAPRAPLDLGLLAPSIPTPLSLGTYCALMPWCPPASHSAHPHLPSFRILRALPPRPLLASHRLVSSLSLFAPHRLVSSLSLLAPHRLDALHLALAACRLEQGRSVSGRGCTRVRRAASDVCLTKA